MDATLVGMPEPKPDKQRAIVSAVLDDGSIVEMIHRREANSTAFLVWKDGAITEHASLDDARLGRVAPYSPDNNLIANGVVLLPSAATPYEDEMTLLKEVRAFIHRYLDVSEAFEEAASCYVLLSWIYDTLPESGYLRLKGDFGGGKSRGLQTIGSLCYKPMCVSGASTVSPIFRIIDSFRGTLIIDESDFRFSDEKTEIVKILNNGSAAGFPVLRSEATPTKEFNPRAFNVFGPKIIASRTLFDDPALESRCITEAMTGLAPRREIPLSLPSAFHDEARELRNKLLMYRFQTYSGKRDMRMGEEAEVEPRVAQTFGPVFAVAPDSDVRSRLIALAQIKTKTLAADRGMGIESQLLEVIQELRTDGVTLGMREIAQRYAERFGSDAERPVTPRWIGGQLRKRLSLIPVKVHGNYVLPENAKEALDTLCKRYRIAEDPRGGA